MAVLNFPEISRKTLIIKELSEMYYFKSNGSKMFVVFKLNLHIRVILSTNMDVKLQL